MMTPQEAYKTLDLAKGLGMDRVEAQFTKLKAEMETKLASTSNERLKQVYSNRLDEIEEAYATLIESLQGGSGHVHERVEIVPEQSSSTPTKPSNPIWLWPVALIFVGIVGLIALFFLLNENSENNGQTEESINGTYINSVGQKLVISNHNENNFDFDITWGVEDNWHCIFEANGKANAIDKNKAFYGDNQELPDLEFNIRSNVITITSGYDFVGGYCTKFGDSSTEKYTSFKKTTSAVENHSSRNQYAENEDVDTRVAKIKEWYSSIQSMINLSKCENVQRIKYEQDGFNDYGIEMQFNQDVRICNVNNEFEVLNGSFGGYESSYQISIYKRYGKIFFVFINGVSEGYSFEERYYADNQEILIKHLIKEAYNGDRLPPQNTEVEVKDKQLIKEKISDQLDDINWVLKAR